MTPGERGSRAQRRARAENGTRSAEIARLEARIRTLEDQNAVLEAEKAALEGYAALAAHELVTPLVIAESFASIVSDRLTGAEHEASREDLKALGSSASRARLLVESLLHDARAGRRPLTLRPVDLDALVRQIVAGLQAAIAERHVDVSNLPVVLGDEPLLSSVFTNLIVNALKYSPRHADSIAVTAIQEPHDWRFVIRSGGPPIATEDRNRIFEPYNRGRSERRERGLGLGLAISRRIVERHGGTIGVTTHDGGNEFFFTIPAR